MIFPLHNAHYYKPLWPHVFDCIMCPSTPRVTTVKSSDTSYKPARAKRIRCFIIGNAVKIWICLIPGCLAHVFPLIKCQAHGERK